MLNAGAGQARQAFSDYRSGRGSSNPIIRQLEAMRGGGGAGQTQNILQDLLGLTSGQTPGGDVLGPLAAQFQQNLDYGLSSINASSPGRFSTANTFTQGQFTQRALNDYNVLAANVLEQGRNRQLQAILGLLGPVLGPMFGGPFTQGSSPWENILGGASSIAGIAGGIPSFAGIPFISPSL